MASYELGLGFSKTDNLADHFLVEQIVFFCALPNHYKDLPNQVSKTMFSESFLS